MKGLLADEFEAPFRPVHMCQTDLPAKLLPRQRDLNSLVIPMSHGICAAIPASHHTTTASHWTFIVEVNLAMIGQRLGPDRAPRFWRGRQSPGTEADHNLQ